MANAWILSKLTGLLGTFSLSAKAGGWFCRFTLGCLIGLSTLLGAFTCLWMGIGLMGYTLSAGLGFYFPFINSSYSALSPLFLLWQYATKGPSVKWEKCSASVKVIPHT